MLNKLLLTGAAGGLATLLRPHLSAMARHVILSDLAKTPSLLDHESYVHCNLAHEDAVRDLVRGVDGIIHLGGVSVEMPFEKLLSSNILGLYNIFEAARAANQPRIIYASSNHVVGFYRRDQKIDNTALPLPDTLYGVTKAFGENLASFYSSKFGQECLSVRIGSCFEKPKDPRMLKTWLAVEDFADLCACAFRVPQLKHTIVYGCSDNANEWWDNENATFLGWKPKKSSAKWAAEVQEKHGPEDPANPATLYQGGGFVTLDHPGTR
jgi:uronate dehydrogenase